MDSAEPRSNKERHYHRPDTGFDESAVVRIVATRKLPRNGHLGSVRLLWAVDSYRQVGIASPKLGMGHRLTHRDAAGGIVLAQRAVGPVGDEEALAIGMEEEAP